MELINMKKKHVSKLLKKTDNLGSVRIRMQSDVEMESVKELREKQSKKQFNKIKKQNEKI